MLAYASFTIESVSLDDKAVPEEVEAVREAFRRYGFDPEVEASYLRKSAGLLPWLVAVVLLSPIRSFFDAFGEDAGHDAYGAVKAWVRRSGKLVSRLQLTTNR